jgi:hypothetical protein
MSFHVLWIIILAARKNRLDLVKAEKALERARKLRRGAIHRVIRYASRYSGFVYTGFSS